MHPEEIKLHHETRQECSLTYRPPPRSERYGSCLGVGNSGSQKVECTAQPRGSGRPRNTNDREDRAIRKSGHFGTNNVASIDLNATLPPSRHPVPSRESHKETTDLKLA
ncbi:hypothetical protein TNCV_2277371 [Trichonephila clavipes]|nr:hypothetical protein TNCV_2277371 [Trichonephila clavipes]